MKLNVSKKAAATTLAGLAVLGTVIVNDASPAAATGTRRTITVYGDGDGDRFSVYADLYDKHGNKVYHWQTTDRKKSVNWNFTEGDGGWLNLWVDPQKLGLHAELNISLDHNICYMVNKTPDEYVPVNDVTIDTCQVT